VPAHPRNPLQRMPSQRPWARGNPYVPGLPQSNENPYQAYLKYNQPGWLPVGNQAPSQFEGGARLGGLSGKVGFTGSQPQWGEVGYQFGLDEEERWKAKAAMRLSRGGDPYYSVGLEGTF